MKAPKKWTFSPVKFSIFLVLILLLLLVIWSVFRKSGEDPEEFLAPVITLYPQWGRIEKTIGISSRVETGSLITLTPRVPGTLTLLEADPGTPVVMDQLIAQVDSTPYDLNHLQAQAAYLTARSTYERIDNLYTNQAATRQQYEEARTAYEAARAQFELAQLNRDYTNIRSPIDGVVLMRHSTKGSLVNTGIPLVTLGDLQDLRIKAAIPEIHYRFFVEHWETMPVRMRVPALGDEEFTLRALSMAPYVSPENRSFLVEYRIPGGASRGLRPGMFVNVSFILESREDLYYLPFQVLGSRNRLWYADGEGKAQFVEFTPEFFNEDVFQVPRDFSSLEFIMEGQHFISPGQRLNILSRSPGIPGGSSGGGSRP
ncbi:MAG: efflux RND transporter periplasmic adaptor subunit [Treponema sp.]|jgi:RND family efflux transporter MFP subunit|nr:efflux RND transporter periplasmic adaptor subunit [Treponema sp.]